MPPCSNVLLNKDLHAAISDLGISQTITSKARTAAGFTPTHAGTGRRPGFALRPQPRRCPERFALRLHDAVQKQDTHESLCRHMQLIPQHVQLPVTWVLVMSSHSMPTLQHQSS